ncbi:unnamed protein product [Penicillium manginii]
MASWSTRASRRPACAGLPSAKVKWRRARGWSELTKPVQYMHQYKRSGFVRQDKLRVRLRNSSAMRQVELEEHGHELLDPDTRGRFADLS